MTDLEIRPGEVVILMPDDIDRIEKRLDRIDERISEITNRIDQRIESAAKAYMPAAVIEERFRSQEKRVDEAITNFMPAAVVEERLKGHGERTGTVEKRVTSMENDKKWLNRMLLGATTAAILSSFGSIVVALVVMS